MKLRRLVLAAALVLGTVVAVPVVTSSTPAWALNCSYGDNFYYFQADFSGPSYLAEMYQGYFYVLDGSSNDLFCQVYTGIAGFDEWVLKGTSACLTLDAAAGYKISLITCAAKASQEWGLFDNLGGETWGIVESYYTNAGYRYMFENSTDTAVQGLQGWDGSPPWQWTLVGPYR